MQRAKECHLQQYIIPFNPLKFHAKWRGLQVLIGSECRHCRHATMELQAASTRPPPAIHNKFIRS